MAVRVETNPNIQFCSCNFFNKKITHRDNRMWFALIFVLIMTMLCQSASLASNFKFLASNFLLWKTNKNAVFRTYNIFISEEINVYTFQRGRQLATSWSKQQVLLRMRAKLLLGGGPQGIANLQQGFLRNT